MGSQTFRSVRDNRAQLRLAREHQVSGRGQDRGGPVDRAQVVPGGRGSLEDGVCEAGQGPLGRSELGLGSGSGSSGTNASAARLTKMTFKWQRGVLRYNCADSLDRTNLASYFAAVQVLVEQCAAAGPGGGVGCFKRSGWRRS